MPTAMAALCFLLSAMGGGSDPEEAVGRQVALIRVGLTCVGTCVAVASGFLFEHVGGDAHRPIGAGNDDHADRPPRPPGSHS